MRMTPLVALALPMVCLACGSNDGGGATTASGQGDSATSEGQDAAATDVGDTTSAANDATADTTAASKADAATTDTLQDANTEADASAADAGQAIDSNASADSNATVDATAPADTAKKDCKCGENQWSCVCGAKGCGNGAYGAAPGKHMCAKTEEKMWENFMPNTDTGWWCDKETNCK